MQHSLYRVSPFNFSLNLPRRRPPSLPIASQPAEVSDNESIMSGPKYQGVPQRDSLDEAAPAPSYSQAPPSYQATDAQQALLSGVPREENDNLPDDFKFGGVVAEATLDIRMAFVRKVYAIL